MDLDGFYLSYASVCVPRLPSLALTFCSSCNETLLSWISLVCCVTTSCWIVEDRCVCHANVSWYPSAYDIVSTLWKKPQTPAIKSTSVSNNNVLHMTLFYVGGNMWKKEPSVSQFFEKHLQDIKSSALVMNQRLHVAFLMLHLHDGH